MIRVTELDDRSLMLNSDLIQHVQETPDTVIVLVTGEFFRVRESAAEVRRRVIEFRCEVAEVRSAAALAKEAKGAERHG